MPRVLQKWWERTTYKSITAIMFVLTGIPGAGAGLIYFNQIELPIATKTFVLAQLEKTEVRFMLSDIRSLEILLNQYEREELALRLDRLNVESNINNVPADAFPQWRLSRAQALIEIDLKIGKNKRLKEEAEQDLAALRKKVSRR